jgi:maltokinase
MSVATADVDGILSEQGLSNALPMLAEYIVNQRWSGGLRREVSDVVIDDAAVLTSGEATLVFTVTRITYADGPGVRYALPLSLRRAGDSLAERSPDQVIGVLATDHGDALLLDALGDPAYVHWLWNSVRTRATLRTVSGRLRFECPDPAALDASSAPTVRPLRVEQSNTSLEIGDAAFLKHLRRIEPGPAHELEMASALREAGFSHFVPILGTGMYGQPGAADAPFLLIQPYMHNATEGWALALTSLRDMYADAEEAGARDAAERKAIVDNQRAEFLGEASRLGAVVAEMHLALARRGTTPTFDPQPITRATLNAWADEMTADFRALLARDDAPRQVLKVSDTVEARFDALRGLEPDGVCTRIHGDLHLGQVLRNDSGWIILDFEGEPDRPPEVRRRLSSPLQDVAGMLRSFDYAAAVALDERLSPDAARWAGLMAYGDDWAQANRDAFWGAYLAAAADSQIVPKGSALAMRRAFEVHKAVYEVTYELTHRPAWAAIPLRFLTRGAA